MKKEEIEQEVTKIKEKEYPAIKGMGYRYVTLIFFIIEVMASAIKDYTARTIKYDQALKEIQNYPFRYYLQVVTEKDFIELLDKVQERKYNKLHKNNNKICITEKKK
jgi:flagellar biosynthesis protein FliP